MKCCCIVNVFANFVNVLDLHIIFVNLSIKESFSVSQSINISLSFIFTRSYKFTTGQLRYTVPEPKYMHHLHQPNTLIRNIRKCAYTVHVRMLH